MVCSNTMYTSNPFQKTALKYIHVYLKWYEMVDLKKKKVALVGQPNVSISIL